MSRPTEAMHHRMEGTFTASKRDKQNVENIFTVTKHNPKIHFTSDFVHYTDVCTVQRHSHSPHRRQ